MAENLDSRLRYGSGMFVEQHERLLFIASLMIIHQHKHVVGLFLRGASLRRVQIRSKAAASKSESEECILHTHTLERVGEAQSIDWKCATQGLSQPW